LHIFLSVVVKEAGRAEPPPDGFYLCDFQSRTVRTGCRSEPALVAALEPDPIYDTIGVDSSAADSSFVLDVSRAIWLRHLVSPPRMRAG
jgi:hypothetical protein